MSGVAANRPRSLRHRIIDQRAYARFMSIRASAPHLTIRGCFNLLRMDWHAEWGRAPCYATVWRWARQHMERPVVRASIGHAAGQLADWLRK
ncbi:MAG: hypothetical protein EOP66_01725 [Sphingomonas sp.]|nr:MAG: hypothetical protein EOP66_01725 [Sphingomonas sp.]